MQNAPSMRWARITPNGQGFVQALLQVNQDKRLSALDALDHPFIKERLTFLQRQGSQIDDGIVDSLRHFAAASKFQRVCMSMMAWSLTSEERATVRTAFQELDLNHSGTISLFELKQVLQSNVSITDTQVNEIFNAMDQRQNDQVNYSDFLAAMMCSRIAINDDLLFAAFNRFDVDRSGTISIEDLEAILGETYSEAELEALIKEADRRGDGVISLDEFMTYVRDGVATDDELEAVMSVIDSELSKSPRAREVCRKKTGTPSSFSKTSPAVPEEKASFGFAEALAATPPKNQGYAASQMVDGKPDPTKAPQADQAGQKSRACTIL